MSAETAEKVVLLSGRLEMGALTPLRDRLAAVGDAGPVRIDLADVTGLDSAAAALLIDTVRRRADAGHATRLTGATPARQRLLDLVGAAGPPAPDPAPRRWNPVDALERLGRTTVAFLSWLAELLGYVGLFLSRLGRAIRHPRQFRLTALVAQMDDAGLRAVPIVVLISFLIGVVIGYQGASQLRQFGAEIFAVDLIAISVLRELGILLTAIIVAGRTASAYTAAIGSMKMGEEIDAMRTMGIDPVQALVVPRVLALILTLIADLSGLLGGAVMAWSALGISPSMFATRLTQETGLHHVVVGLVKAPVFALLIGVIGCQGGMRVRDDAASLGMTTSASVVAAIFAVIAADAFFSVFFAQMGW